MREVSRWRRSDLVANAVQQCELTLIGDATVRVFEKHLEFTHVNLAVESHSEPPARPHVRGIEKAIGVVRDELLLRAFGRGAPQMSEDVVVMTVHPQDGELATGEECGSTVTWLFGDLGQGEADIS